MEVTIAILGGIIFSFVSFELGNRMNGKNKVSEESCKERRDSCNGMVCLKIDNLHEKVDEFIALVKK